MLLVANRLILVLFHKRKINLVQYKLGRSRDFGAIYLEQELTRINAYVADHFIANSQYKLCYLLN